MNAVRHSHGSRCLLRVWADTRVHLEVVDDGVGIRPESVPGIGLGSIHDRVDELGGTVTIGPPPGGGTRLSVALPLTVGDGDADGHGAGGGA